MNILTYIIVIIVTLILVVGIIGVLLPKERVFTYQSTYEAPAKLVLILLQIIKTGAIEAI